MGAPKQTPITKSETVQGPSSAWAIESQRRQQLIYPSNHGQAGVFRVRSGEALPNGSLAFGIGGEFYTVSNAPNLGTGAQAETISETLFVGFNPWKRLTIGIGRRNSSTTYGSPQQLASSLGDFNFGTSYSFPVGSMLAISPIFNLQVASDFNNLAPANDTFSAGVGVAATYGLFKSVGLPLFLHANLIYHMPQIRGSAPSTVAQESFFNFSRFHQMFLGLAAEIKLGDFIPFVELTQNTHFSSAISFGSSPSKLSLGSRFQPLSNKSLSVLLGVDIGLGKGITAGVPFSPDYQIIGQVSYTVALSQTERKHYYTSQDVNIVDRKFIIRKNIKFKVDSAELEPSSSGLLDQIANVIKQNKVNRMLIVGHTDSSASEEYNVKLSKRRAETVKAYFVNKGIQSEALVAQGQGKRKPIASNATEVGRARNRRVDFFILE